MKSIFDRMERKVVPYQEYEKIELTILNDGWEHGTTIESWLEQIFLSWKFRNNFISLVELRDYLGFPYGSGNKTYLNKPVYFVPKASNITVELFLNYCELVLNLIYSFYDFIPAIIKEKVTTVTDLIFFDLENMGFSANRLDDGRIIITEKDAATLAVADITTPELSDAVLEYNHYLLKGKLDEKRTILNKLAKALESKRAMLTALDSGFSSDLFSKFNNMDIRHDNVNEASPKYQKQFAVLSDEEKESWYDDIYQDALFAFLLIEQKTRRDRYAEYKRQTTEGQ